MPPSKIERKIQRLVSRFFKKAATEVVTSEIVSAVAYEKQFNSFTGEQRKYICLEVVSRVEGEEALDYAKELIEDDYNKQFFINKTSELSL